MKLTLSPALRTLTLVSSSSFFSIFSETRTRGPAAGDGKSPETGLGSLSRLPKRVAEVVQKREGNVPRRTASYEPMGEILEARGCKI